MAKTTAASLIDAKPALLGECVVYLGGLNYFFTVDESTPVVSRIGAEIGRLQLRIAPHLTQVFSAMQHLEDEFVAYERVDVDSPEEQIHEHMDRPLQYRVELRRLSQLAPQRFSHVSLRYTFFRETSTQTSRFRVDPSGDSGPLDFEFRHVVDVNDALVKYVTASTLSIEVRAYSQGLRSPRY
ncbi:HEAT repeat-containing protein 2 [Phytophthora pseudosyringae]|uniref:HEAT repeat-containing protein 2 n=1 Tax=Phytophthora pseudosyringae TaxID=221518 RepID=A0A8T1VPF3_9STRA|nr:HEAT repeat-containing protein 2 [Phytophthora pseudosyringae]